MTVATHGDRIPFSGPCASGDHHHVWILAHGRHERAGTRTPQINMAAALHHQRYASVVAVVATDVDPSQSVWRPRPAPAAVVGGVGVGQADESKAMMAVMEEPAVMRKPCMRKTRTREAATCETEAVTCETDAAACETHAADTHAAAHAAEMHSTPMHPAMHAAHAATTMAAAPMTAAAAASERGWRKRKRRSHRTRGEAIKELVFHPNPSVLNCSDRYRRKKEDNQQAQMIQ